MKKYFREGLFSIFIPALLLLADSCTPLSCFEETESFLKASFYTQTTQKIQAPDSITLIGLGKTNSYVYKKALKLQPVLFPLNPSEESCTYIIKINNITDTITFNYTAFPHLISKECGYTYYYTLTQDPIFTDNAIKSIGKTNYNVTTLNGENFKIYY